MKIVKFIAVIVGVLVIGIIALVAIDSIPMGAARPPAGMNTKKAFSEWRGADVTGQGTYTDQSSGIEYDVLLAPSGRNLASGPSAYLFTKDGRFVEWTPDMGDVFTSVSGFDLSSGNVQIQNKSNKPEMVPPRKPSD